MLNKCEIYCKVGEDYGDILFVPNYEKLEKSKFGGKYNKGGTGREKNKNRVRLVKLLLQL